MRVLARHLSSTCRRPSRLLEALRRNPELSGEEDARAELRWMRAAADSDAALEEMVQRRALGEPLQYILGDADFGPLTLGVRPPVLIPRPETAHVVEVLAGRLAGCGPPSRRLRVLDLCTGSGCIPLLLAHLLPGVSALGVDVSRTAIALAEDNAERLLLRERVRFTHADILAPEFVEKVSTFQPDIITANPPYISLAEYATLAPSVREWEDEGALVASDDGLAFYHAIARLAPRLLANTTTTQADVAGIRLAVEIGATQGPAVVDILPGTTEVVSDQYGRDRMVAASVF